MKVNDFVRQLNYPTCKIDGNFILNNKVDSVIEYINNSNLKREESIDSRNQVIAENKVKEEALLKYLLEEMKIDQWKIFKQKKRGKGWTATTVRGDMYAHWKKAFEDVKSWVPLLPAKVVDFGLSNERYVLIYNNTTLHVSINRPHSVVDIYQYSIEAIKRHEESVAKENRHLVVAKEFLDKKGENYSELFLAKDIIDLAENLAMEEYEESISGDEIEVTHGDGSGDCIWSVEERRCMCGNNRYYLEIEGNLIDGYYSYGQWH